MVEKQFLKFIDEYKTEGLVSGEFEHAKPKIDQDKTSINTHDIFSYSRSEYNYRTNPLIDAADYYMSTDIAAKLKSREAIYKYFNMTFDVKELTCKEINEKAMDYVLKNWKGDKAVLDRFAKVGQKIEWLEDSESQAGPTWVNRGIITKNTTDTFQVQSRALLSPVDFFVPVAAGMLYCKLMSPARILEWMIVDGLKKNLYWVPRGDETKTTLEEDVITFLS